MTTGNLSSPETDAQPAAKLLPGIPVAIDLPSALAAIKALTQWVSLLGGATPATSASGAVIPGSSSAPDASGGAGGFVKRSQTVKQVKITDPNDPAVFVIVDQITDLVLQNSKTGELWTWHQ